MLAGNVQTIVTKGSSSPGYLPNSDRIATGLQLCVSEKVATELEHVIPLKDCLNDFELYQGWQLKIEHLQSK